MVPWVPPAFKALSRIDPELKRASLEPATGNTRHEVKSSVWGLLAQILVCLTVLIGFIFLIGFKLGKRRFLKVQEDMKALELAFNQVLEQMEHVSENNLKVLETQTQDLRDLLQVADKKCLYVNDLFQELDGARKEARALMTALPAVPTGVKSTSERHFHDLRRQVDVLLARLDRVEQNFNQLDTRVSTLGLLQVSAIQQAPPARDGVVGRDCASPPHIENSASRSSPVQGSSIIDRFRKKKSSDFTPPEAIASPRPGTRLYEVLKLLEDGVTVPQIARRLKMGKGEVELILNLYGTRAKMRKVI